MATRFYFPEVAASGISPSPTSDWEHTTPTVRAMDTVADTSGLTTEAVTPDSADDLVDKDSLCRMYVSGPLAPQTISGNVKAQFQILEAHANNNLFLTIKLYVMNYDGTSTRGTLLAITRDNSEPGTTLINRQFASTAISSVTCQMNDRIVAEIGLGGTPGPATGGTQGHNGSIRWGCSASSGDLPEDDTQTGTTFRPWLEFDANIMFGYHEDVGDIMRVRRRRGY